MTPSSRRVLGCAFEVSEVLDPGSLESVYEKALCVGLAEHFSAHLRPFAFICGKKENIEQTQWWVQAHPTIGQAFVSRFLRVVRKSRTQCNLT